MKNKQEVKKKGGNKPLVFPDPQKEKMVNYMKAGDMAGLQAENEKHPQTVASLLKYNQMMECYKHHPHIDVLRVARWLKLGEKTARRWYSVFDTLPAKP